MKDLIKITKQYLIIVIVTVYSFILGPTIIGCVCDCTDKNYAKLGDISLIKSGNTYQAIYSSSLDQTEIVGTSENSFDLSFIKSIVDAGIDKHHSSIYVKRGCFDQLRNAYSTIKLSDTPTYKHDYENPILNCEVYGDYPIAMNTYDKSMYDSTMINKIQDNVHYMENDPRRIVRLINR